MQKKENQEDIKADLKHDSMRFSAATDGEDKLDRDDAGYEEEDISAEELELLADDPVETDSLVDETIMPEEDWTDDLPDNEEEKDENIR